MTILVTGATGNVGKHVVAALAATGEPVRAVTRTPSRIPEGVQVAHGGIADVPKLLDGVDRAFLLWPFTNADDAAPVVSALAAQVSQVVFLSARGAADDDSPLFHARIEKLLRDSGVGWTFLRAGGFATNTLEWADQVRTGVVRWVHGNAGRSLIHERDIADVAVTALTSPVRNAAYDLTGPETLTQAEQVRLLGAAVGREVRWEEMPVEEARASMLARGWDEDFLEGGLAYWSSLVDEPETVTGAVEEVTGKPARTFAQWATDHADDFR